MMTEAEMRTAIAEMCPFIRQTDSGPIWFCLWRKQWIDFEPTKDLSAIHEAVARLTNEQYNTPTGFTCNLGLVVYGKYSPDFRWQFRGMQEATAMQRAEAICRTLWPEMWME